jgi:hypothetical protein
VEDVLIAEFEAACEHAGVSLDKTRLWLVDGDPLGDGPHAVHYSPGWLVADDDPLFGPRQRAEANAPGVVELHRIAVRRGGADPYPAEPIAVAGLVRHEVEHVRQFGTKPFGDALRELDDLATRVADAIDGGRNTTYRTKPVETAANRAAAAFLRGRHPTAGEALRNTPLAPLTREGALLPVDELPRLTVEWIAVRSDAVDDEEVFGDGMTWIERVDSAFPGAAGWWPVDDLI